MSDQVLVVKNMVCHRCVMAVQDILNNLSIAFIKVEVGEIHLDANLTQAQRAPLAARLKSIGLELIGDHTGAMIEKIKHIIIRNARNELTGDQKKVKLSVAISEAVNHEYTYISSVFSAVEGRTIESYFIEQRIEKAKELLVYGQMTLSQIALELDYSSTAHLSAQFKKFTGLTPTYFKKLGEKKRKMIDQV